MAHQPQPLLSSKQERDEAETREVIERAERAWQRQVERERADRGPMTPLRWVLVAIAAGALILLLVQR